MTLPLPDHPITWLFLGDSITHGLVHTHGQRSFVEHVNETVRGGEGRIDDVLINSAVSGWQVGDLLARWEFHAARFSPDVAIVMYGTNDARNGADGVPAYREGLTEIIDRLRAQGAQVVLQVPPPIRAEPSGRVGFELYCEAVRELAREKGLPVVDHPADWAANAPGGDVNAWLADDIHPNAEGHRRMAEAILDAVWR